MCCHLLLYKINSRMEEQNKFQEAQQQVATLFQAAQSALLPARDHQVIQQSAQALAQFLQDLDKDKDSSGDTTIAMPD